VTTLASDSFTRSANNGWGSADIGGSYTLQGTASNFSVSGGVGSISLPSANANRAALLNGVTAQNVNVLFRVRLNKLPTGGQAYAYADVRRNGNNAYRPKVFIQPSGAVQVHAGLVVNNSESSIAPSVVVPGLTYTANSWLWFRAEVSGTNPTTIRVRVWLDGQAEPSTWQYSVTNSNAAVQTAGAIGLRAYVSSALTNAPITFGFDDLTVAAP
jgi:hypothetical protein